MTASAPQQELQSVQQLLDAGRFDEAWARMEPLLAACPDDVDLAYLHGVLEFRRGSLERASAIFEELLEREPMMYRAQYALGLVALKTGSPADAVTAFERTLYLRPSFAPARERLRELGAAVPPPPVPPPRSVTPHETPPQEPPPRARQAAPPPAPAQQYAGPRPSAPRATPPAAHPAGPPVPAADLAHLVPWPVRAIRLLLLLGLGALLAWSALIALLAAWALVTQDESSDLGEAAYFGTIAAVVAVVTALLFRAARRLGSVTLTGAASQVRFRQDVSGSPRSPKRVWVLSMVLVTDDRHQYRFPRVPVELRTKQVHGEIGNGEPVQVVGRPVRDGYLKARRVRAIDSGLTFRG